MACRNGSYSDSESGFGSTRSAGMQCYFVVGVRRPGPRGLAVLPVARIQRLARYWIAVDIDNEVPKLHALVQLTETDLVHLCVVNMAMGDGGPEHAGFQPREQLGDLPAATFCNGAKNRAITVNHLQPEKRCRTATSKASKDGCGACVLNANWFLN